MAEIKRYKSKQTGMVVTTKVVDGDPVEFSKTKTSEIKSMSTKEKIQLAGATREQNKRKR